MLLYIIPFVLLLVVAIVLKKREASQQDTHDNKANKKVSNKKSAKKNVAKTARTSQRQQTQTVEEPVAIQETVVEVNKDLKQKIETLIKEKNYSAAEAQINLALNQDNRQHGLYLSLLDIHLAQKDEFAVNQLLQYLRSLGLHDIVQQAEERQTSLSEKTIEVLEFDTETSVTTQSIPPVEKKVVSADAFDSLINPEQQAKSKAHSFDLLQDEYSSTTKTETPENLKTTDPVPPRADLEFTSNTSIEKTAAPVQETSTAEPTVLEFDLAEPKQQPETTQAREALDFSFGLDTTAPTSPTAQENVSSTQLDNTAPLEFSFDAVAPVTEPVVEEPQTTETLTEFKLDFEVPVTPTAPEPSISEPSTTAPSLDFKLDSPALDPQPSFSFDLSEPQTQDLAFESQTDTPIVSESTSADPLAQAFPVLLATNDITLNLDLAEQYIELGAYDAARQLLAQNQESYSVEQKQHSENLLNRIAS
ncbi:hypothetical protein [Acinetobacter sp. Marseille-Q1618]|uniref:hypothetical protein n=1 Tax=Acinetobacter sp. Marseille-Q1618 TaxID=2697502 RepID=UPI00156E9EEA|nr:hypothetical protein [Acinetobacter sp. Marseille-Q1618]